MSDPEIDAIRAILTSRPRPSGLAERRDRLDGLGRNYPTRRGHPARAGDRQRRAGRMVDRADGGPRPRDPVPARRRLHFGLDREPPATRDRDRARCRRAHPRARLSPRAGASVSRGAGGYRLRLSLPAGAGDRAASHRGRRRQRRRRAHHRADGRGARARTAAAVMRLVHLAVGRSRERRRHHGDQGGGRSADPEALSHGAGEGLSRRRVRRARRSPRRCSPTSRACRRS